MNDYYIEQRVKQNTTGKTMIKMVGMLLSAVVVLFLTVLFSVSFPPLFMLAVPYVAFAIYFATRCNYEFEYLFCQGDLDIDRISAKSSRKRLISAHVKEIEILAPTGSEKLREYEHLKKIDCSSNTGNKTYELVAKRKNQLVRVVFEPEQKILNGIKMLAPRKVFLD